MSDKTERLLRAIRDRLLPVLERGGFEEFEIEGEKGSAEMRRAFPFGHMRRTKGTDLELLEVQLDVHGAPKFVLNFGIAPVDGVDLPWGVHVDAEDLTVSALRDAYRLHSRPHTMRWFSPGVFHLASARDRKIDESVGRVLALYPQVEVWFQSRVVGPNVRKFGIGA